jgi:hypothetical protein
MPHSLPVSLIYRTNADLAEAADLKFDAAPPPVDTARNAA